jgi:hypothetical protein
MEPLVVTWDWDFLTCTFSQYKVGWSGDLGVDENQCESWKAMNTKSPNSNHMAIKSCEMEKWKWM